MQLVSQIGKGINIYLKLSYKRFKQDHCKSEKKIKVNNKELRLRCLNIYFSRMHVAFDYKTAPLLTAKYRSIIESGKVIAFHVEKAEERT